MKTLTNITLCLALLTATINRATAQETFAPLISENCVAFVHVDFSNVEIDNVKAALQNTGEFFLRQLGFDDRSFTSTARELAIELEKLDMLVRPAYDTIRKELSITEYAFIADFEFLHNSLSPPVFAVPWKDKTDKQLETLCALLNIEDPEDLLVVNGFLFIQFEPLWADDVIAWVKAIKPAPANSPIFEALKSVADAEIKAVITLPEQLRAMARSPEMFPPDVPREVRDFILFASQRIQWASASLSFQDIFGEGAKEGSDVLLTVKTTRPSDAVMLRNMLEQLIDLGVNSVRFQMAQETQPGYALRNPFLPFTSPLAFEFARGVLRTLLPDVEEDRLIFRVKGGATGSALTGQVAVAAAGIGTAMLLPAIQTSREAARRAQCANNLRQITLALHNYHDALGAFPPLYTVDAEGKPLHSWRVLILPFIEQGAMYDMMITNDAFNQPWDSEFNKQFHDRMPAVFQCPSNPGKGCCYVAIASEAFKPVAMPAGQRMPRGNTNFASISDGTSNTLAFIEVQTPFNWMDPMADITLDELAKGINGDNVAGSHHRGGCNVGFFDGSVRFISESIDLRVLRALGTPAGGESMSLP
ncbi:MAG: DUF1559 domain-containing protein [Planctomycetaceae bacterium]|nr:DUF1559 domain-containing protein [Planctomycetaceae bacterium]